MGVNFHRMRTQSREGTKNKSTLLICETELEKALVFAKSRPRKLNDDPGFESLKRRVNRSISACRTEKDSDVR